MAAMRNRVWVVVLALAFTALTPSYAWAYVDPGTGSYLFQLAAAGLFAGMFTLRRYWYALKARLGGQAEIPARTEPSNHSTNE
jgi:hypothetical protein